MVIAKVLDQEGGKVTGRRLRSTLAHEGGHGLLHTSLFKTGEKPKSMFDDAEETPRIFAAICPTRRRSRAGMMAVGGSFKPIRESAAC